MTQSSFRILGFGFVVAWSMTSAHADLNISKKPTQNMTCSGGVCTATAKNATLNVDDLTGMLGTGDVTVKYGGGALAIQINDGFSWTNPSRLTLDANTSVGFHKPVTVAGEGALTITTNDGGSGGDLKFFDKGKIDFRNRHSSLIINCNRYRLAKDLQTLAANISRAPSGFFALARDYDASADRYQGVVFGFTFAGHFEGLAHIISNLSATSNEAAALFQTVGGGGAIRDLDLQNVNVVAKKRGSAAAVALTNAGSISNISVSGSILCYNRGCAAGGVTVSNTSTAVIQNARVSAVVETGIIGVAGGIASENQGTISGSFVTGTISTGGATQCCSSAAGGLAGYNAGTILLSHANAHVDGGDVAVTPYGYSIPSSGGLVGLNNGVIDRSFAAGSVTNGYSGGLVGYDEGTIENSYSLGMVSGFDGGGLVGDGGNILNSYSTGATFASGPNGGACAAGGFIGCEGRAITGGYWDIDTSGVDQGCGEGACSGVTGLTDSQLKSALPAGFDPNIWGTNPNINNGYPYLLANPPQ